MTTLNADASTEMVAAGASAATDLTGFGLLGHLGDLCRASGAAASIRFSAVPLLPSALRYAREGFTPGGTLNNWEYVASSVELDGALDETARLLLADPQTSGGLLVALPPEGAENFLAARRPGLLTAEIGRVEAGDPGRITVSA
jgi:selenide,water dikinase